MLAGAGQPKHSGRVGRGDGLFRRDKGQKSAVDMSDLVAVPEEDVVRLLNLLRERVLARYPGSDQRRATQQDGSQ